jgi:HAE1 family hydrophobic/amphiphilic exporter-1
MPKLNRVPGISAFVQNPPSIRIGGRQAKSLYQYTLQGPDLNTLDQAAIALQTRLQKIPQLVGVTTDLQIKNPEVHVLIDRDRASSLGITATQIERTPMTPTGHARFTIHPRTSTGVMESMPQFER